MTVTERPQETLLRMFDEAAPWPSIRDAIRAVLMPETALPPRETTLDEAWAVAEKALPDDQWRLGGLLPFLWPRNSDGSGWKATARDEAAVRPLAEGRRESCRGVGPTPAAALLALAAALGRSESGGGDQT